VDRSRVIPDPSHDSGSSPNELAHRPLTENVICCSSHGVHLASKNSKEGRKLTGRFQAFGKADGGLLAAGAGLLVESAGAGGVDMLSSGLGGYVFKACVQKGAERSR
jgi:hypothetical protein